MYSFVVRASKRTMDPKAIRKLFKGKQLKNRTKPDDVLAPVTAKQNPRIKTPQN